MGWGAGIERVLLSALAPVAVVVLGSALAVVPSDAVPPSTTTVARVDPQARVRAATVLVHTTSCSGERTGSGVLLDGEVLTNAHVVAGAVDVRVRDAAGSWRSVGRVRRAAGADVAALELLDPVPEVGTGLRLRTEALRAGTPVWTAGHPEGGAASVSRTRVHRRRAREVWTDPIVAVELDARVRPGQSGSPVVDATGRLAGLVYASSVAGRRALVIEGAELRAALARMSSATTAEDGLVRCPGPTGD